MNEPSYRILVGDVRDQLGELADDSVDCVVTSPPYFGLRDYGTGEWVGGDPDHEHERNGGRNTWTPGMGGGQAHVAGAPHRGGHNLSECDCGARLHDQQIGLEETPAEYVAAIVEVFREVRRVLAPHGTAWLNLGDTYNTTRNSGTGSSSSKLSTPERQRLLSVAVNHHKPATRRSIGTIKHKDLIGVPWRVALALQDDGWWLRSEIIWSKPAPMPESVTDRPSRSHEHVFMLTRSARYWFDQKAVLEPTTMAPQRRFSVTEDRTPRPEGHGRETYASKALRDDPSIDGNSLGRNVRTVWEIASRPFDGAHFAVFPIELPRRCVLAGAAREVCLECGEPRRRILERGEPVLGAWSAAGAASYDIDEGEYVAADESSTLKHTVPTRTVGWTDCGHGGAYRRGVVLDPFLGAGTTALAAMREGRDAVGIELNPEYADLARARLDRWWEDVSVVPDPPPHEGQLTIP